MTPTLGLYVSYTWDGQRIGLVLWRSPDGFSIQERYIPDYFELV